MKPLLGLRAHDFGPKPAEQLAPSIAASGAACVQLALAKALPEGHLWPSDFKPGELEQIRGHFDKNGLSIAVLGCYIDMVTPDDQARELELQRFEAHVAMAGRLNCTIVGTETGSPDPYLHHPDGREQAFQVALAGIQRLSKAAEAQSGVRVGLEPVAETHAVASATHARRVLDHVNSPALGIIFDPVNLVPPKGLDSMEAFLDECFDAFGDKIIALHAKDFVMDSIAGSPRKRDNLPAGTGVMDWVGVFTRLIKAGKQHVPILLEDAGPDSAALAFTNLRAAWLQAEEHLSANP
ncbi:sugar phosphate isomerase/epimerase family protein [Marinimicrobium alkaliphilum]|uniref:sugar phosphate isomerase/epimerase family protein n=1 Tax=Marinimicrobium alkaliphilum TaxID=2202654 RepID=UPI000DBA1B80|nr:sugar phosphate isomerase/epimerase family protein [Marinimicrobium alkaliphilum]